MTDNIFITNNGTYTVTLNVNVTNTSLTLGGSIGIQTLAINAPTLTLNGAGVVNANGVFALNGGTLAGSGSLTLAGALNWTTGTMSITNVTANGGITLSTTGIKSMIGGTLVNTATANWSAGNIYFYTSAVLSNAPSGIFNETFAGSMVLQTGTPIFANAGQFNVNPGSGGIASVAVAFNNTSAVNIQSGTLSLSGGGTTTGTGSFSVPSGTDLDFAGGTYNLALGSSVTGAGNFSVSSGTVNENGTFNVGGTNTFSAGTANFLGAYTISGNTVNIVAGTANFMPSGAIAPGLLSLAGGILGASNTVTVSGMTTWTAGTIQGNGTVNPLGGLTISGAGTKSLNGGTLINAATATWNGGNIYCYGSAVLSNAPSGTFNETFAGTMTLQTGSPLFANAGQFNVNPGSGGTASISVAFNNSSTVNIQSGTLSLSGGGTTTSTGSFSVPAGTTLDFSSGTYSLALGSSVTGAGNFSVSGATVNESGTFNVGGTNTFSAGTANFLGAYTISGNTVNIVAGTANFMPSGAIAPGLLSLAGGILGASNTVTVSGMTSWTAGTIQGNSTVNPVGGLTISGTGTKSLSGCTLINTATANWSGGTLYCYGTAVVSNAPGGTFNETFAGNMTLQTGSPLFANAGQFNVNPGSGGSATFSVAFNNSSTVSIQSGSLSLMGGGTTTSTGSFAVPSGATLDLHVGTFNLVLGSSVSGAGLFSVSGATVNENGTCAVTGTNTFSSGTVNINPGSTFTPVLLNLSGATLGLSNNVSVSGLTTWTGGAIQGNSTLNAMGGLTISSAGFKTLTGCTLINTATANWSGGTLYCYGSAVLSNAPSGTFNETFAGNMTLQSGSPLLANAGQFNVNPGSGGIASVSVPFTNSGTVQVLSGTLNVSGLYDQTAGLTLLNGGNINNTSPLEIQGGTLAGNGVVSGSVTNNGSVSPGMSPGELMVGQTYAQTTNGALDIELAGTVPGTSFDLLVVTNTASLAGTLNATLTNGFYPAANALFTFLNAGVRTNTFANFFYPSNLVGLQLVYTTNSASIQVINVRPVINPVPDQNIPELVPFSTTATATDADLPPQTLTWSLISGPTGLTLNSSGVLNWTPSQTQSPSTNTVVIRVTDNGTPPLSVTNSFAIVVYEVNIAPTLPNISTQTVDELTLLTVTNTATESNIHATNAGYFLLSAPAGVSINDNGVITWTPSQLQSPSTNLVTTVATNTDIYDLNNTHLNATNTFTVIVREVNVAPVLPAIPTRTVNALAPLTVTNTASESNIHATLGYFLLSAPPGAGIDASGVIHWTPTRPQGPGTNLIATVVTNTDPYDLLRPHLSATNSFTVIVYAPTLSPISNYTVNVGRILTVTNSATDNDPSRTLTFSLGAAPVGASITPATGVFSWRAAAARAGTSNYVQVIVTDNNSPPLSDTKSFAIFVNAIAPVVLTPVRYAGGHFTFSVNGSPGPDYIIQASGTFSNWTNIGTNTPAVLPFTFTDPRTGSSNQYYRVLLRP
jgi:hypothetical protein